MKKLLILCSILVAAPLFAQEQIPEENSGKKKEVVSDNYNRNGVAVVPISRGGQFDATVMNVTNLVPDKYDHNRISVKSVRINQTRGENAELNTEQITEIVNENDLGREIIAFIFNRKADGTMDDALLQERGMYNATDQDILKARASAVGTRQLAENYDKLIKSSYLLIFDENNIYENTTKDKKGKTYTTYYANATANVYRVSFDLNDLWATWIYPDDSESIKESKQASFKNMNVTLIPEGRVSVLGSDTNDYEAAIQNAYDKIWDALEKQIDAWQVRVYVQSTNPIQAKVGTKESLSNGTRYRSYSYKENNHGDLVSVKKGFVRATTVVDNKQVATGESEMSRFYQISGNQNIQEGWLIKEDKDKKIGGALDMSMYSGSDLYFVAGVSLDYLLHIGEKGMATYALVDIGYDLNTSLFSGAVGAGAQFRIIRPLMIMPYIYGRAEFDSEFNPAEYFAGVGAKLSLQFKYPWQIYVKAGPEYSITSSELNIALGFGIRREF